VALCRVEREVQLGLLLIPKLPPIVQRAAGEVEGSTAAVEEEAPSEDIGTTTTPEEPQAETTTVLEESPADAEEELPIEEYDSLNVEQIREVRRRQRV